MQITKYSHVIIIKISVCYDVKWHYMHLRIEYKDQLQDNWLHYISIENNLSLYIYIYIYIYILNAKIDKLRTICSQAKTTVKFEPHLCLKLINVQSNL